MRVRVRVRVRVRERVRAHPAYRGTCGHVQHLRSTLRRDPNGQRIRAKYRLVRAVWCDHLGALGHDNADQSVLGDFTCPCAQRTGGRGIVVATHHTQSALFGLVYGNVHRTLDDHHPNLLSTVEFAGNRTVNLNLDVGRGGVGVQGTSKELHDALVVVA